MLKRIEQYLCIFSLICLTLLPVGEIIARFFNTGIPAAGGITAHLLLMVGLLTGMITTREGEHLSIALIQNFSGKLGADSVKRSIGSCINLLSAFIVTIVAWSAVAFLRISLSPWRMIGFIPDQVFALVMPIGYFVIALRFARMSNCSGKWRILPVAAVILGTLCAFPAITKTVWGLDTPDPVFDLILRLADLSLALRFPVVIIMIIAAFCGMPLFVVFAGLSIVLIQGAGGELDVISNQVYTTLINDSFIPIPLFTLTGFFLSESKAGERLVNLFRSLFSWLPGGMIIATVVICAFFTSFTGASGVTILALGGILYSILHEVKYSDKFSIGLLTSVGSIGLLFPPSLPIILVGTSAQTNILHMFLGGIIPGILLISAIIVFGIIISVKTKIPVTPFSLQKAGRALKDSALEVILPFLLIAGYFSGTLSLTETGAAAALYIFIVEVCVHRDIKFRDLPQVFAKAIPIIGGVLSILALSQALSYYIIDTQVPENLARWMQGAIQSKYVFLLLLNLVLLVVGCLMDIFSAILVVLPLIVPLGLVYGIDPVHLGIIFITNLEVGFLTPPVGMNLFLAAYRFGKPFVAVCRYVFPFLLIQLIVVLLVTYVPWFSTFLPSLFQ
ncbi:TRAP transporter subunit DctM [Spirochaetia bacterium]|nr:TRAP transporter subunit DctM [Spirochaetia bacterium]